MPYKRTRATSSYKLITSLLQAVHKPTVKACKILAILSQACCKLVTTLLLTSCFITITNWY